MIQQILLSIFIMTFCLVSTVIMLAIFLKDDFEKAKMVASYCQHLTNFKVKTRSGSIYKIDGQHIHFKKPSWEKEITVFISSKRLLFDTLEAKKIQREFRRCFRDDYEEILMKAKSEYYSKFSDE